MIPGRPTLAARPPLGLAPVAGRRHRLGLGLGLGLGLCLGMGAGCGASSPAPGVGLSAPAGSKASAASADGDHPMLPAHAIGTLDEDGALASFARTGDDNGLLVFAQGGSWRARGVDRQGAPRGEVVTLAPIQGTATHLVVRPVDGGFVAVWDVAVDRNHALWVVSLDPAGAPRAAPVAVAQVADRVGFIDVLAFEGGALLLHEIPGRGPRGQESRVTLTPIDPATGAARGPGAVVVDDTAGWNVVATRRGAAVARVVAPAPGPTAALGPILGRVEVALIDARGATAPAIAVLDRPTANIDVELAAIGDRLVVGWTDGGEATGAVQLASVDLATGKATSPQRVSPPAEDVALVGLWAAPRGAARGALVAWEPIDPERPAEAPRRFVLAPVDGSGALGSPRAALPFAGQGRPDVVADGEGFAALLLAPAALAGEEAGPDAPIWPTFVRMGPDLTPRASEPLRAELFGATEGIPDLAFGLSCAAGGCLAVGGSAGAPAQLAAIDLAVRASPYRPALVRSDAGAPREPRAAGAPPVRELATTLWSGERVADVAAARLDGGSELVAWVGWFQPGMAAATPPPRGEKPFAAMLAVRPIAAPPEVPPTVISQRAFSMGGVALAPLPGKIAGEAVLAWVASDDGIPQVFATKLDASGQKLAQKKVTIIDRGRKDKPRSECAAVDVAYAPQATEGKPGIVVAWIDSRDGDREVYAARLNTNLEKVGADRRVTTAKGDASEVRLLVKGAETWVAWIEAREAPDNGDVYVARLRTGSLEPVGEATRIFASAGATRGVRFVEGAGGRTFVSWIDDAARDPKTGAGADGSAAPGLRLVELDAAGKPSGAPRRVSSSGASVLDAALGCSTGVCRGLAAVPGAPPRLLGVQLDEKNAGVGARDVGTAQGNGMSLAPIAGDGAGFVLGDDDGRAGRIRHLRLGW